MSEQETPAVGLEVLELRKMLTIERLKNIQLMRQGLDYRERDLADELEVLRDEIAKRTPKTDGAAEPT